MVHARPFFVDNEIQHTTPPETLVDEIFGALSKNTNTNNSGNGKINDGNEKPAGVDRGSSNTRAALKELASSLNTVVFPLL